MYVLSFFVNQTVTSKLSKITLSFKSSRFFYMLKKSRQKLKYLKNEKSFKDEMKSIFHYFVRAIIEANKKFFWKVRVRL